MDTSGAVRVRPDRAGGLCGPGAPLALWLPTMQHLSRLAIFAAGLTAAVSAATAEPASTDKTAVANVQAAIEAARDAANAQAAIEAVADAKNAQDAINQAKAAANLRSTDDRPLQTTGGITGLSRSTAPVWVLVADTNVTTLDVSQPSAGLGLEYATPFNLARFSIKKNVSESTLTAAAGARDFGRAVLRPATANFSLAIHAEHRFASYLRCRSDCYAKEDSDAAAVTSKWSWGAYATLEAADLNVTIQDAAEQTLASGHMVPLALTAGLTSRIEGVPPEALKSAGGGLVVSGYAGIGLRVISGDVPDGERALAFGTARRWVLGPELGVAVQFGTVIVDARLTGLSNFNDAIPGLTGAQLQAGLTFVLPWEVVGGKDKKGDDDAEKAAAEKAAAEKAAAEKAAAEKAAAEKAAAEKAAAAPPAAAPPAAPQPAAGGQ
ncbi:MAG: hypothetical protein IPL61_25695 [Myxococcales bacterium]|nr:hypothetical protein [Myxococcales bacterium]